MKALVYSLNHKALRLPSGEVLITVWWGFEEKILPISDGLLSALENPWWNVSELVHFDKSLTQR